MMIRSANIMTIDPQQDPPQKKTQHKTNASASVLPAHAPPVCTHPARSGRQINSDVHASCWSTAKMNRSRKSLLCSCALNCNKRKHQRRQTITQRDAARRLFWRLAAAKERQEERNNNQNGFFFSWGVGAISPEPKKDDGAQRCGEGVPRRARGGNKMLRADIPRKEKETTIKMDFSFVGEWAPFLRAKER
jgi:hypothetical protein